MNDKLRRIHLITGLSVLIFMLLYFGSGFLFYNNWLFPDKQPEKTTRTVELTVPSGLDNDATLDWLASELNLSGRPPHPPRPQNDGRVEYDWTVPGKGTRVMLSADKHSAEITTSYEGLKGTAVGYHFVHGYGDGLLWSLWALVFDLASAGCIVFACSGIGIWLTGRERDGVSWVMLPAGLVVTVGMILYYMVAM